MKFKPSQIIDYMFCVPVPFLHQSATMVSVFN